MSNLGLERFLAVQGINLERTKVGDRYVLERMREGGFNVGGEQSGHMILSDYATTGDGTVAALQVLAALVRAGKPASEVLHQFGASVNAFPDPGDPSASPPLPGRASASNTYLLAGVEYDLKWFVPRYNLSIADYHDLDVREVLHLWGVTYPFHAHGSLYVEYAWWDRFTPEGRISYDRSINLTVMGYF